MAKRPNKAPRKVVTDIDAILAEADYKPYEFTLKGKARELPHLRTLLLAQIRMLDAGDFEGLLPDVAPDDAADILALPAFALDEVIESWLAHGGVDLGELLASASS